MAVKTDPFKTESDENQHGASDDVVSKSSRNVPTESVKQDRPVQEEEENLTLQSYVWLANGEVLLVDDEDAPTPSGGTNAPYGHWQRGNQVHTVIGVYPAEITVKG
jgi:hypothetical protein